MLKLGIIGTHIITDQMLDAAKTTGKYQLTAVYSRTLTGLRNLVSHMVLQNFMMILKNSLKMVTLTLFTSRHQIVCITNKHA